MRIRIALDAALVACAAAPPVLTALGVWRWRRIERHAAHYRATGQLPGRRRKRRQ